MIYRIVQDGGYPNNGSPYNLEKKVQELISKGFKPIGGVSSFQQSTGGGIHTLYSQAMIKPGTFLDEVKKLLGVREQGE